MSTVYDYNLALRVVMDNLNSGALTKEGASRLVHEINEKAWELMPNSEPDGDIDCACADALDKINEINPL